MEKSYQNLNLFDFQPQANIKTDRWLGYKPLKSEFANLIQLDSGEKGGNFPEIHRAIMMFKSWLRGIYHSVKDLQVYIDEYTYRFNRHLMKASIFDKMLSHIIYMPNSIFFLDFQIVFVRRQQQALTLTHY